MPVSEFVRPIRTSKTLTRVLFLALAVGLYSVIPIAKEYSPYRDVVNTSSQYHAMFSLILGLLLVFRTNTAYNRWWEARTLWGALVNASRNAAIKLTTLGSLSASRIEQARELLIAFPIALRHHLRDESESRLDAEIRKLAPEARHVPLALARQLYVVLNDAYRAQEIDGDQLRSIDLELLRLMDICGGCERILKTRIVKSYRVFARQCVVVFLATLPWGVAHDFRIWTAPITIITAYFMLGLETVAEHVEEPFGYDEDDLDLDGLCRTIEASVDEVVASRGRAIAN
jgi:putative membrane protein